MQQEIRQEDYTYN